MDRIINTKTDKQTIYEIYRACRLCGGGAGYKMPIVQSVIDLDNNGVELKQKIQECLQIEVHQDDKMPPLICELCVDKVNDFYDFMEICKQTNRRTRMRLGLPAQTPARSVVSNASSDSGDCILGVTEPILVPDDDNEPLSKSVKVKKKESNSKKNERSAKEKVKVKKEKEQEVKTEKAREPSPEVRKTRNAQTKPEPAPPAPATRGRGTWNSGSSIDDNVKLSTIKNTSKSSSSSAKSSPQTPRSVLKKELRNLGIPVEEEVPNTKRVREKEVPEKKPDVPSKKAKITMQPAKQSPKPRPKSKRAASPPPMPPPKTKRAPSPPPTPTPKPKRAPSPPPTPPPKPKQTASPLPTPAPKSKRAPSPKPKRAPSPPPILYPCSICSINHKTNQGKSNHMRSHVVTFTNPKLACDPCAEWFSTAEESSTHHRKHKNKPYYCRHCYDTFKTLVVYYEHFEKDNCQPFIEVPDKKCDECWRTYATQDLLDRHRCPGPDGRPGGKCKKCDRMYTLLKNLQKHESSCTYRKKGEAIVDPEVEKQLKDTQIRLTRCDELLTKIKGERYDISHVDNDFGFDSSCIYPYRYRIKSEPTTGYDTMVTIGDEIKQEYYAKNYVHWDSEDSDSDNEKGIESLTAITLKTIFSNKLLGKVPRKRRRIKSEKFDNTDFDMSRDIDSIIDNLSKDDFKDSANDSDCSESIFGSINKNLVKENTFDDLVATQNNDNIDSLNDNERVVEKEVENDDSQDSQSVISAMPNQLDLSHENQINDVSRDVSNGNDDEVDRSTIADDGDKVSNVVDNQNTNLSKTENNDTSKVYESLDSNDKTGNEETNIVQDTDLSKTENNDTSKENESLDSNDKTGNEETDIVRDTDLSKTENNDTSKENESLDSNDKTGNEESDIVQNTDLGYTENNDTSKENERLDSKEQTGNEEIDIVQNTDFSCTENNDKSQDNEKLDSSEQCRKEDSNSVSDTNGVTESINFEKNTEESDVKINGETNNHSNDNESTDLIDENNDKSQSVENNDKSHENNISNDPENGINKDVTKVIEEIEGLPENNEKLDDLRSENDKFTLDDIVSKENNLKDTDLDSISDEEFNFDL